MSVLYPVAVTPVAADTRFTGLTDTLRRQPPSPRSENRPLKLGTHQRRYWAGLSLYT